MLFHVKLPEAFLTEKTEVTVSANAGSAVALTVKNNSFFAVNDFVIVRNYANEKAELARVTALSGTASLTVDTLDRAVVVGDVVTKVLFDKVLFYGATTETGSYGLIDGEENLKVDSPKGNIFEYIGNTLTFFKFRFKNSVTGAQTTLEDSVALRGTTVDLLTKLRETLRDFEGFWFTDSQLIDILDAGRYELSKYITYTKEDSSLVTDGTTYRFTLPFEFSKITRIGYFTTGSMNTLAWYTRDEWTLTGTKTLSFGYSEDDAPESGKTLFIEYGGIITETDIPLDTVRPFLLICKAIACEDLASDSRKYKRESLDDASWEYGLSQGDFLEEAKKLRHIALDLISQTQFGRSSFALGMATLRRG